MFVNIILLCIILYIGFQYMNKQMDCQKNDTIKILLRQASKWTVASTQDSNPIVALLHANYGVGYISALRDIATDKEIEAATGIDINGLKSEIISEQNKITTHVMKMCSNNKQTGKIVKQNNMI